ncbi:hypothetical protein TRIATDRAFT_300070, partial [Trichoderma atroviride IMI 206040]
MTLSNRLMIKIPQKIDLESSSLPAFFAHLETVIHPDNTPRANQPTKTTDQRTPCSPLLEEDIHSRLPGSSFGRTMQEEKKGPCSCRQTVYPIDNCDGNITCLPAASCHASGRPMLAAFGPMLEVKPRFILAME